IHHREPPRFTNGGPRVTRGVLAEIVSRVGRVPGEETGALVQYVLVVLLDRRNRHQTPPPNARRAVRQRVPEPKSYRRDPPVAPRGGGIRGGGEAEWAPDLPRGCASPARARPGSQPGSYPDVAGRLTRWCARPARARPGRTAGRRARERSPPDRRGGGRRRRV